MTDDIHSQAYLYVVGALDPEEVVEFEAHLSECSDCQKEVADMREVTAQLSETAAAEPPNALRASVLAQIAQTPQEAPTRSAERPAGGRHAANVPTDTAASGDLAEPEASNVVPMRRSWTTRASVAVAAAAVIAAAVFGGWAINERNDARDQADVAADQAADLSRVIAAPDAQQATADVTGGGRATVVRSDTEGQAFLVTKDLPDLASGKVYEAWTIEGSSNPVPAGTFTPDGDHAIVELTPAALQAGAVALSVEPTGGSEQPTTTPIVAVDLTAQG